MIADIDQSPRWCAPTFAGVLATLGESGKNININNQHPSTNGANAIGCWMFGVLHCLPALEKFLCVRMSLCSILGEHL